MPKQKIVLVEDERPLARVISEELKSAGFTVYEAFDGEAGLKMVREKHPDLVLLDLMLPKQNGFKVLELLKRSIETKDIPVIILTALDSDEDIKKGLDLGANDYIVKSQHAIAEIIEKVENFFKSGAQPLAKQPKQGEQQNE